MAIHHRVSDYAREIISRAYKVVKVENPFATGLDDIQRSLSSLELKPLTDQVSVRSDSWEVQYGIGISPSALYWTWCYATISSARW